MKKLTAPAIAALTLSTSSWLHGQNFTETTDAPSGRAGALILPAGTRTVSGVLTTGSGGPSSPNPADTDVYSFSLSSQVTNFQIDVVGTGDPTLFLLDSQFRGIEADDDAGGNLNPRIITALDAGTYYIGIARFPSGAYDAAGNVVFTQSAGVVRPPESLVTIAAIGATTNNIEGNNPYTVTFNINTTSTGSGTGRGDRGPAFFPLLSRADAKIAKLQDRIRRNKDRGKIGKARKLKRQLNQLRRRIGRRPR